MAFLSAIASHVVVGVLSALCGWFLKMLHTWQLDRIATKANEEKNAAVTQELENAKTKEQRDSAAQSVADKF